jgi:hypothetical protein
MGASWLQCATSFITLTSYPDQLEVMVSFRMFPWRRRHYLNNSLFRQRISFSLPFIVAWVLTQHTSKLGIDIYLVNG